MFGFYKQRPRRTFNKAKEKIQKVIKIKLGDDLVKKKV